MGFAEMFGGNQGGIGGDPYASKSGSLFDSMFGRNLDAEGKGRRMMMGRALMSLGQGLASQRRGEHWASAATRGMSAVPGIIDDQQERTRTDAFRERIGSMAEMEEDPQRRMLYETLGQLDPSDAAGPLTSLIGTGMQVGASRHATDVGAKSHAAGVTSRELIAGNRIEFERNEADFQRILDREVEEGRTSRATADRVSRGLVAFADRNSREEIAEANRGSREGIAEAGNISAEGIASGRLEHDYYATNEGLIGDSERTAAINERARQEREFRSGEAVLDRESRERAARLRAGNAGGFSESELSQRMETLEARRRVGERTAGMGSEEIQRIRGKEEDFTKFGSAGERALAADIKLASQRVPGETEDEYNTFMRGLLGEAGSGIDAPPVPDVDAGEAPPVVGTIYRHGPDLYEYTDQGWELVTEEELGEARRRQRREGAIGTEFPAQEYMR